jgi:peptide/nickel transport system substrate-binding protein
MKRILLAGATALAVLVGALAPAEARTVRWSASGDPNTMDPHSQNVGTVTMVLGQIYEGLISRNKDLGLEPGLATAWRQTGPTTWRFELRRGVTFHDGAAFTAADVVFSLKRALEPTSNYGIFVDTLADAVAIDDFTVDVITKIPDPILTSKLAYVYIMNRAWSERNNVTKPQNTRAREETFTVRNTNGTGPFRLSVREPDVRTVMLRNDAWWGWGTPAGSGPAGPGNVTEIVYRPISSDATRVAALLSGEIDFVLDPPLQDLNRLRAAQGMQVLEGPEIRTIFFAMDVYRDELLYSSVRGRNPMKDLRVRQALYHALDIEAIRSRVMRGQSIVTGTLFPPQVNGYNAAEDVRLPYNVERARALLREAGYADGFDITLDCPNNRYINDEQICLAAAAMWTRIGVRTSVNAMPLGPFFAKIQKDDTSLYLLGWGVPTLDALYSLQSLLASRGSAPGDGIWNYGRYANPAMDAIVARVKNELDPEKRNEAIREALRIYRDDVPHIPLHHQMIPWAMRAGFSMPHMANNQPFFRWMQVN